MTTGAVQETPTQAQETQTQETQADDIAAPRSTALTVQDGPVRIRSPFESRDAFDEAVPLAKALAQSTVVPEAYRNKTANCLIALELAQRSGTGVLMVMQNLHIINGRPGWSSAFLTSSVNTCGRFSMLRYEEHGEVAKPGWKCRAYARELSTGDVLFGPWVTWEMAIGEGWVARKDSKWKTMPELMIGYRASAFWTRKFAPEIALGMHTADELADVVEAHVTSVETVDLNKVFQERAAAKNGAVAPEPKPPETEEDLLEADRQTLREEGGQGRML
jgi:hypothetical protein